MGMLRVMAGTALALAIVVPSHAEVTTTEKTWPYQEDLYAPVKEWVKKIDDTKNADGAKTKYATYSKSPRKVDDGTWLVTVHVNTAEPGRQVTERYDLTVKHGADGKSWTVADAKVVDTYVGLFRWTDTRCHPFDKFSFKREGLEISAGAGEMCEDVTEGEVLAFVVHGASMTYQYAPPQHAMTLPTGHDYYAVHRLLARDHSPELSVQPAAFHFACDAQTCKDLIAESFTGLKQPTADAPSLEGGTQLPAWVKPLYDRRAKERKADAFAHFREKDYPGHRYYFAFVSRDLQPLDYGILDQALPGSGVLLTCDNWAGWEVEFSVYPPRVDQPETLAGTVFGYYTEATLKANTPEQLERREDIDARWHEVDSVKGTVEMALADPETLAARLAIGIKLKQSVRDLPFSIIAFRETRTLSRNKPAPLFVNSIRLDGQELTWVRTGGSSGRVVLPKEMPAGSKLTLEMDYSTRAIIQYTPSFSYLSRFGWMPLVRFGDFIDEFDLTVKSPSKYEIIGIGQRTSEKTEGDVLISQWKASQPVVFPSIIFGKYRSDKPKFDAKKIDGTVIPVTVHVDDDSFTTWDIRPDSLRPIAEQAANSINLYTELSGIDYPYGELNLVNDPQGFLYGQSPSSLIYLGSGVFRGEGFLASLGFADSTSIAKFLKSVVAHEVGHQWWGSRVSNANQRNYWFVESLAEYFSAVYLEAAFGWKEYMQQVDEWRRNILKTQMKTGVQNASSLYAGEDGFRSYQSSVYSKGPYAFHILRETFKGEGPRGPDTADKRFFEALKRMTQTLSQKREIVTLDIQNAAEDAFAIVDADGTRKPVDLDWFFDQWIRGVGLPQFDLDYTTRKTEDGGWVVEGRVRQRVVLGTKGKNELIAGQAYRGRSSITVIGRDKKEYPYRLIVNGAETPFAFKVPVEPRDVILNRNGEVLALDPVTPADGR
jgi:hypothetical protein